MLQKLTTVHNNQINKSMFITGKKGIKFLSGCSCALANDGGVYGNVGLSSPHEHRSAAFNINSSVYSVGLN